VATPRRGAHAARRADAMLAVQLLPPAGELVLRRRREAS
jgi:hypothetical protein